MIKTLYAQIADRLAAQIPELQWIDLEQGQLENLDQEYAIPFPAAFVDFDEAQWNDIGGDIQRGEIIIRVTLVAEVLEDSYQVSTQRAAALAKLELTSKVHQALHHWQGTGFSKLARSSQRRERSVFPLWAHSLAYRVLVTEALTDNGTEATAELEVKCGQRPVEDPEENYVIG